ncbi:MAG: hypothetical protein ACRDRR_14785 [Pseudonocardiaceae bacterium]
MASTSARSPATGIPSTWVWNTRRTPVTLPCTRTTPSIEATRWKQPGNTRATASNSAAVRTLATRSVSRVAVTGHDPITAARSDPTVATVTSS